MHKDRALLLVAIGLILAIAAFALRETGGAGWMPGCFFKKTTGFDCPGCGMTRASHAFLNGQFLEALRFNPVGMILFPLALIGVGLELVAWARGKALPIRFGLGRWGATIVAVVMIVWWVTRNIWWPLDGS
ncbi:MAG: DUF2752 domain-containing protein [Akkermansiaceae bacterium]